MTRPVGRLTDPLSVRLPVALGARVRQGAADRDWTLARLFTEALVAYLDGGAEAAVRREALERRRRIRAEQTLEQIRTALAAHVPTASERTP